MSALKVPRPRGQNVVLLALMMLFMVLMVTMTIGLGVRIRQQHELQNLADAAAYSSAVETARAYNNAALINRAEVSVWVAMAADQSLIDWTSYARGMANAAVKAADQASKDGDGCKWNNDEGSNVKSALTDARSQLFPGSSYIDMDNAAGAEALSIQGAVVALRMDILGEPTSVQELLNKALSKQSAAHYVRDVARLGDVQVVEFPPSATDPKGAAGVNRKEVDCDFSAPGIDPPGPGLCSRHRWTENMLHAAMGTRGNPFVTVRGKMPTKVTAALAGALSNYGYASISFVGPTGSAYWAKGMSHGASMATDVSWADDHGGSVTLTVRDRTKLCSSTQTIPVTTHLRSTDRADTTDQHIVDPGADDDQPDKNHTMGTCTDCPSVWVRTIGFSPADAAADAWGQPKLMVALERDQAFGKPPPWELHFKFPFSATGPVRGWDARGDKLHTGVANNLSVQHNVAISTAMAYYHRRDHWEEFPNLLNPFWRATLVPVDVDNEHNVDVPAAMDKPEYRAMRDAFKELTASGYEGLH